MAGIYIHVPFCQTKCYYCDFYSTPNFEKKSAFIDALLHEIEFRRNEFSIHRMVSVYFGGGTPSLLLPNEISLILNYLHKYFQINTDAEITMEVNPDDLNADFLQSLVNSGINRLSIGVQSFDDTTLRFLNRRHTSEQARQAVELARNAGFKNISVDLIYGLPGQTNQSWKQTLYAAFDCGINHISAYHFTLAEKSVFGRWAASGKIAETTEDESINQYETLCMLMNQHGYHHYEISNFARPGFISVHNMLYWTQKPYLGLGPSAHSYTGETRIWNPSDIDKYCHAWQNNINPAKSEHLSLVDKYNEMVITSLRISDGLPVGNIKQQFGQNPFERIHKTIEKYVKSGHAISDENRIGLTEKGMFIANHIMLDLMVDEENEL